MFKLKIHGFKHEGEFAQENNNNNKTNKIPNNNSNNLHSPNTNHSNPHHVEHGLDETFLMCDDDHELGFSTSTPNIVDCIEMNTSLNSMGSSPTNSLLFYGDNSSSSSTSSSTNELNLENYNYSPTMASPSTRLDDGDGDDHEHDNDESTKEWEIIYGLLCDIPTNIGNNNNIYNPTIPPLQYNFNVTTTSSSEANVKPKQCDGIEDDERKGASEQDRYTLDVEERFFRGFSGRGANGDIINERLVHGNMQSCL
mgnify:CR=1 FL=1